MAAFENTMGINTIQLKHNIKCFCPIGKSWCTYQIEVTMEPGNIIPDYLEVAEFFDKGLDTMATLEKCCADVLDYFVNGYEPKSVCVTIHCDDAKHMPVTVSKSYYNNNRKENTSDEKDC